LISRNLTINNKRTSIRLENHMWDGFLDIASRENCTIHELADIIHLKVSENLTFTAAVRVFIMLYYKAAATEKGHSKAKHGCPTNLIQRTKNQLGTRPNSKVNNSSNYL